MKPMKTPGVYIVEKSAFPNSVVQVATAVPAFVGYTQKAMMGNKNLHMVPKRLSSMAEFESFFGGRANMSFSLDKAPKKEAPDTSDPMTRTALPHAEFDTVVNGKPTKYIMKQTNEAYCLYTAMRHFFLSGGGACYVVSCGDYKTPIQSAHMIKAMKELVKEQEPTMVVIPETTRLDRANSAKVQQQMLQHCGYEMKNRVAIVDIHGGFRGLDTDKGMPVAEFRNDIGTNFVDFGSAYYPWFNTAIYSDRDFSYNDIEGDSRERFVNLLKRDALETAGIEENDATRAPMVTAEVDEAEYIPPVPRQVTVEEPKVVTIEDIATVENDIDPDTLVFQNAPDADTGGKQKTVAKQGVWTIDEDTVRFVPDAEFEGPEAKVMLKGKTNGIEATLKADGTVDKPAVPGKEVKDLDVTVKVGSTGPKTENIDKTLRAISPLYKEILNEMTSVANTMPPSGAMAGIYTMVDSTRGVWKAPANVSVPGVTSPCVNISHDDQEDLNVSPQGKSINAIRPFVGEGTLVWGARTLDGNSLDWRYISVRRTMIMLEESIRLASKAYVFEPNVANTWVTMKAMIENFLHGIWKQGGLAGAVPEDAFSVHCGLGSTMTPVDILEGILRITVLVAVSRPAEFIEITFQQQMQKS